MRFPNLKIGKIEIEPVPLMLVICFTALVVLIIVGAWLGQQKLNDIRRLVYESTEAYGNRVKLTGEIREAAVETINQARLHRTTKAMGFPGPVYKIGLNKAKFELIKLTREGRKTWGLELPTSFREEKRAWNNLDETITEFLVFIDHEESNNVGSSGVAQSPTPTAPDNQGDEFFQRRRKLEAATDSLTKAISTGLEQSKTDSEKLKNKEVSEFLGYNGGTLLLSIIVIIITVILLKRYIDQIKNEVRLKMAAQEELRRSKTLSAVGQITAQVAHEIYNPLGAVKLNIDLLEMQVNGNQSVQETIGRLKRGVEHLSTIIMDLRYLTRTRDPELIPTNINTLLDEALELAGDRFDRSRILITKNYSSSIPDSKLDPQQLRKVFLNLLINAVEASSQHGNIEINTEYSNSDKAPNIIVHVIDHGSGMSEETKSRMFEAFYTTKNHGTGLGMMITNEIIKKHGGHIEVESEIGKGTTITVQLPYVC